MQCYGLPGNSCHGSSGGLEVYLYLPRNIVRRLSEKSIFGYKHNQKVFEALQTIQRNQLGITFKELEEMYNANVDFQNFIDVLLLVRSKNINVSREVLRTLAYSTKDLMAIINTKNPSDEVQLADAFRN